MLSFKQFLSSPILKMPEASNNKSSMNKIPTGIVVHSHRDLIPTGIVIHSKLDSNKKSKDKIKESLSIRDSLRMVKSSFKRLPEAYTFNVLKEYNYDDSSEIKRLHNELSSQYRYTPEEREEIGKYANSSFDLNAGLLGKHHYGEESGTHVGTHNVGILDRALDRPLGRKLTVYSGLGFNPLNNMSKEGYVHMPAYTSTSLSKDVARDFAGEHSDEPTKHVLKLDLHEHNLGGYLGKHGNESENEFLLPRNSTVKIHRSEDDPNDPDVMIHHGTVEHDIDPNLIERNPRGLLDLHKNYHGSIRRVLSGDNRGHWDDLLIEKRKGEEKELMDTIKRGYTSFDTILKASNQGILNKDHLKALADSDSPNDLKLVSGMARKKPGFVGSNIIYPLMDKVASDDRYHDAQYELAAGHNAGHIHLGPEHIDRIIRNPSAGLAHNELARTHLVSPTLSKEQIDTLAKHKDSRDAHRQLVDGHIHGDIGLTDDQLSDILSHRHSIPMMSDYAINNMMNKHKQGLIHLNDDHLNKLASQHSFPKNFLEKYEKGEISLPDSAVEILKSRINPPKHGFFTGR